ncbi:tyrosine-type recombinase/integrase [Solilutibacter pythonis]|uniref:tyrosine-type recombinase/integrase n=1 Tax=Solilutibacter pythonis TaxID=2483112 RepID=UPI001FEADC92|nr:tyrosine-type recombinase/integrase [Lysobacter pythonis]
MREHGVEHFGDDALLGLQPKRLPHTLLAVADIDAILHEAEPATPAGLRDRAMLELLYATGLRRMELPAVTVESARTKARAILAEADQHRAPLVVIEAAKPKLQTLGEFIHDNYAPWANVNQKAGQATVNAIDAVFGDLYD